MHTGQDLLRKLDKSKKKNADLIRHYKTSTTVSCNCLTKTRIQFKNQVRIMSNLKKHDYIEKCPRCGIFVTFEQIKGSMKSLVNESLGEKSVEAYW